MLRPEDISTLYYRDGYDAIVARPFTCQTDLRPVTYIHVPAFCTLTAEGLLTVWPKYGYDGASFPVIRRWRCLRRASLVHDSLYQLMRAGLLGTEARDVADRMLYDIAVLDGMWRWVAEIVYWARRWFTPATRPSAERVVKAAP